MSKQIRGLLAECGVVLPKSVSLLRKELPYILEDAENKLTTVARSFINEMNEEIVVIEAQIQTKNSAAVGNAKQFQSGRQMAAWVWLTPKLYASGDSMRMGGITKRGNSRLRKLMIDGARAIVLWVKDKTDRLSQWIKSLLIRMHYSKVLIAVANKLTRMAWAILSKNENYVAA